MSMIVSGSRAMTRDAMAYPQTAGIAPRAIPAALRYRRVDGAGEKMVNATLIK